MTGDTNRLTVEDAWRVSVEGIGGDNYDQLRSIALQLHDTMRENERLHAVLQEICEERTTKNFVSMSLIHKSREALSNKHSETDDKPLSPNQQAIIDSLLYLRAPEGTPVSKIEFFDNESSQNLESVKYDIQEYEVCILAGNSKQIVAINSVNVKTSFIAYKSSDPPCYPTIALTDPTTVTVTEEKNINKNRIVKFDIIGDKISPQNPVGPLKFVEYNGGAEQTCPCCGGKHNGNHMC